MYCYVCTYILKSPPLFYQAQLFNNNPGYDAEKKRLK